MNDKQLRKFKVAYRHGLMSPVVVEARSESDASVAALAEFRRRYGSAEMVHDWPVDRVVESAVPVDAQ